MTDPPAARPVRPRIAFRLGVTGARTLPAAARDLLRPRIETLLHAIAEAAGRVAADATLRGIHAGEPPLLRLITPLAEGADRLVAEIAAAKGWCIEAVLPFSQAEYETDFAQPATPGTTPEHCLAEFRACLGQAACVLELDGDGLPEDQRSRAYDAAGRAVVRNADLLIAIWDGVKARKRGGTSEIVRFAARSGPPVWWLRADGSAEPCVLEEIHDYRTLAAPEHCADPMAWLAGYLDRTLRPAPPALPRPHGDLERALGVARRLIRRTPRDDLRELLDGPAPRERALWTLHARVREWVGRGWQDRRDFPPQVQALVASAGCPRDAGAEWCQQGEGPHAWHAAHAAPDAWANAYAARYRTTYLLVAVLISLALAMAVLALALGWTGGKLAATVLELFALLALLGLVSANLARRWHQHWLAYRLIGELCRHQHHLAALAWSLPLFRVGAAAQAAQPGSEWVGWYFNALARTIPLPAGRMDAARLAPIRTTLHDGLMLGQVCYHAKVRPLSLQVAARLERYGERLFLATLAVVAIKLAVLVDGAGVWVTVSGFFAALLPILSAGFFAFRAYSEFNVLAAQSARMLDGFVETDRALASVDVAAPLASQALGVEAYELAGAMLVDIEGWATLFRVKVVEAG